MSRCEAVDALYQDMAARHRARFRSIHVRFLSCRPRVARPWLTTPADHQGRRGREGRGHPPPLHQAAPHQEPQVPPSSPYPQDRRQEGLRRSPPRHLLLSVSSHTLLAYCWLGWREKGLGGLHSTVGKNNPLLAKSRCSTAQKEESKNSFFFRKSFTTNFMTFHSNCSPHSPLSFVPFPPFLCQ